MQPPARSSACGPPARMITSPNRSISRASPKWSASDWSEPDMQGEAYLGGRILIVDDEESNVVLLQRMLARAGYGHLTGITDSRNVLQLFQEVQPDLVLLDLMMPHLDGFAVMEQLAVQLPEGSYVPILVLTADVTPEALRRALSAGARDFLTKPFDQTELLLRVKNLLETRFLYL